MKCTEYTNPQRQIMVTRDWMEKESKVTADDEYEFLFGVMKMVRN